MQNAKMTTTTFSEANLIPNYRHALRACCITQTLRDGSIVFRVVCRDDAHRTLSIGETGRQLRIRFGEHRRAVSANDANQPVARHFYSGSHCNSDIKIRALCPISGSNDSRKDRKCVSFPNLEPYTPLVLTSVFPSFSVTCLCLACSDIGRSNPTFVFIVLLALCMLSHITPILTLYI